MLLKELITYHPSISQEHKLFLNSISNINLSVLKKDELKALYLKLNVQNTRNSLHFNSVLSKIQSAITQKYQDLSSIKKERYSPDKYKVKISIFLKKKHIDFLMVYNEENMYVINEQSDLENFPEPLKTLINMGFYYPNYLGECVPTLFYKQFISKIK